MLTTVSEQGNYQIVYIPQEFHFDVDAVEIFRAENGDVILRVRQKSSEKEFEQINNLQLEDWAEE